MSGIAIQIVVSLAVVAVLVVFGWLTPGWAVVVFFGSIVYAFITDWWDREDAERRERAERIEQEKLELLRRIADKH